MIRPIRFSRLRSTALLLFPVNEICYLSAVIGVAVSLFKALPVGRNSERINFDGLTFHENSKF